MTIREFMDEAIRILDTGDAVAGERFLGERIAETMGALKCSYVEARNTVLSNIAYAAGYYSAQTATELRKFYRTSERIS